MASTYVTVSTEDGIAVITMARPPVNAMDREFVGQLGAALDRCEADGSVWAIVIASGLSNVFSGGADIREMEAMDEVGCLAFVREGQGLMDRMEALPKPIIAAVSGACVGGGCELAMSCDLRVAGSSSSFGQPEVNLGVLPGWGGSQRMPRLVGKTLAMELLMTGEAVSAEQALDLGLLNLVVPDEEVMSAAKALAGKLLDKSPSALAVIKAAIHEGFALSLAEGLKVEARRYREAFAAPDAREGMTAFLEKRAPRFTGL